MISKSIGVEQSFWGQILLTQLFDEKKQSAFI